MSTDVPLYYFVGPSGVDKGVGRAPKPHNLIFWLKIDIRD